MKSPETDAADSFVWARCLNCGTHRNMIKVFPNENDTTSYRLQCPLCGYMIRKIYTTYIQGELFDGPSDSEMIERELKDHPERYPDLIFA